MINGAHTIIYSRKPEADRAFFKDVLNFDHIDVGGGKVGVYEPLHARP